MFLLNQSWVKVQWKQYHFFTLKEPTVSFEPVTGQRSVKARPHFNFNLADSKKKKMSKKNKLNVFFQKPKEIGKASGREK